MKVYTFDNKVLTHDSKWLKEAAAPVDPYNPLGLPPNTIRVRTSNGNAPDKSNGATYETATLVSGTTDVYDVYKSGTSLANVLTGCTNLIEVLGANTTGITNMNIMFMYSDRLASISLFDTSNVTMMESMLYGCEVLTSIPLFNTSNVLSMDRAFYNCYRVQSGALALYQQASTQATPPMIHDRTFYNCGIDTTTGTAELAQIPSDWK